MGKLAFLLQVFHHERSEWFSCCIVPSPMPCMLFNPQGPPAFNHHHLKQGLITYYEKQAGSKPACNRRTKRFESVFRRNFLLFLSRVEHLELVCQGARVVIVLLTPFVEQRVQDW